MRKPSLPAGRSSQPSRSWSFGRISRSSIPTRATSTARLWREARSCSFRLPLNTCMQATIPMPTMARATAISSSVNPARGRPLIARSVHVHAPDQRVEGDADTVRAIAPRRHHDVCAARAAVGIEEDLPRAVAGVGPALNVLDHGAIGELGPAAPVGRGNRVAARIDDELLGGGLGHRLYSAVDHGGSNLARRPAYLARVEAALDERHGERDPDGDDQEDHRHLDQREAAAGTRDHPLSPCQLVMSRLLSWPPGAPSAPSE